MQIFIWVASFLFAVIASVIIGVIALLTLAQWRANKRIRQRGGSKCLNEIISELQDREYSLVSLFNEVGKPEIRIYPQDVGEQWEMDIPLGNKSPSNPELLKHTIALFKEAWGDEDAWILEPEDEIFTAIAQMSNALNVVERSIGYPAARKLDYGWVNVNWDEYD